MYRENRPHHHFHSSLHVITEAYPVRVADITSAAESLVPDPHSPKDDPSPGGEPSRVGGVLLIRCLPAENLICPPCAASDSANSSPAARGSGFRVDKGSYPTPIFFRDDVYRLYRALSAGA